MFVVKPDSGVANDTDVFQNLVSFSASGTRSIMSAIGWWCERSLAWLPQFVSVKFLSLRLAWIRRGPTASFVPGLSSDATLQWMQDRGEGLEPPSQMDGALEMHGVRPGAGEAEIPGQDTSDQSLVQSLDRGREGCAV